MCEPEMLAAGGLFTVTVEVLVRALIHPVEGIMMLISESVTSFGASVTPTVAFPPVRLTVLVVAPPSRL